jgi:Kef-type K+ transport system membrane component KefB
MEIFIEMSIILLITTAIATLMRVLRQPLIIGYVISGILIGPFALNILHAGEALQLFSQIGIAMLLFIVGLSLNPDTIKETGGSSLAVGLAQMTLTSIGGFVLMRILGFTSLTAIYAAVALTLSSTIIVLKSLSDQGEIGKLYGKISLGILLTQDVVASLLLIIIPILGSGALGNQGMIGLMLALKGILASIGLYIIAKYLLPRFSDYLAQSQELLFLFALSWGLVLATAFYLMGFSLEIGALIAGITLAPSKYTFEISSRLRPLRDFFIVLFFVLLGSHVVMDNLGSLVLPAIILTIFVLVGNPFIVFMILNLFGYRDRTAFMAGLTMAQVSEFSLILMALGYTLGQIPQSAVTLITLVSILTITGSTYLFMYRETIFSILHPMLRYIAPRKHHRVEHETPEKIYDMIIFGFGRVGYEFVHAAQKKNLSYLVIDENPETFTHKRAEGVSYRFGDAEDIEFLDEIHMQQAHTIISTIPDHRINVQLARYYRKENSEGVMMVMSHNPHEAEILYQEGVSYVILPHYLGAYHASEMVMNYVGDRSLFDRARAIQLDQIHQHHQAL